MIGNLGKSSTIKATPQEEASFYFERSENPTTQRGVVVVVSQVGCSSSSSYEASFLYGPYKKKGCVCVRACVCILFNLVLEYIT